MYVDVATYPWVGLRTYVVRTVETDPANARYWHEANAAKFAGLENGTEVDMFEWAMTRFQYSLENIDFVGPNDSRVINE